MNIFKTSLRRASVNMSMKRLRQARAMAIRGIGSTDQARVESVRSESRKEAGPGSVKEWADAMKIKAPKRIATFIRRKLR
jgi:hypothetical protein